MILTRLDAGDIAAFFAAHFQSSPAPIAYRALVTQCLAGSAWAARPQPSEPPAVVGGLFWFGGERPSEAWSVMAPGIGDLARPLALQLRTLLREAAPAHPGIVCRVKAGNVQGQRFARVLGFEFVEGTRHGSLWRLRWKPCP